MNRRDFIKGAAALAVVAYTGVGCKLTYESSAAALVANLDPANHPDPDTVANCLHAYALLGADTSAISDQLWDIGYSWSGHRGWGITAAWDAFADDSVNPIDTVYGYTTCRAALAFQAAGDTARANEAISTIVSPGLWDGTGIDYSTTAADRGYSVWNIHGLGLWALIEANAYPDIQSTLVSGLEAKQGVGTGVGSWNWEYYLDSSTKNDCHHWAFIVRGLQRAGSVAATTSYNNLHRFHGGSGATKQHDSDMSSVTQGRDPGWHCALATWSDAAWADDVADDIVASISDGQTSYRRASNSNYHADRDQAHTAYGLAVRAAAN